MRRELLNKSDSATTGFEWDRVTKDVTAFNNSLKIEEQEFQRDKGIIYAEDDIDRIDTAHIERHMSTQ